ncbi:hypothetical protein CW751_05190 [Brumimicrobium salinarum]|uniref:TonB-dependent receptor n=1 Tax=Brumimicrobium salinarum TaxID=2058658 RepID=A0A2I0R511_9FLAO|nr:hypothetical protein [Brumimicrobium salinarum]PKR81450.1 hypothetical protein CW751_05190 [Brumimicrobium salinarum]
MNRYITLVVSVLMFQAAFGQNGADVEVVTDSDRSIAPAKRIYVRPQLIDTSITSPVVDYPLLVLQKETSFEVEGIEPANIRHRPQLSQLYNGYARIGAGSRLMGLGEVYYNSLRSRKFNWGIHALHHSEWGQISDYAPSQYDKTRIKAFGKVEERRYSYGGGVHYKNQGLHYYGFQNPDADRDSIKQRYQSVGFNAFYDSHKKDSATLNYRIGLSYDNFLDRKPQEDSLKLWRARENYVGLRTTWQYNTSSNVLLSNLRADLDISYNDYRYGEKDTSIAVLDTAIISQNTIIQLRPMTSFYSMNGKLQFKVGGELAIDIHDKTSASLYPIAEARYSLFNDIFIPYAGIEGGLKQQRFAKLANRNEFIQSNQQLQNERRYEFYFGFKGTLSSRISFNASAAFSNLRNHALFINDTVYASGNEFRVIYDTVSMTTISASLSYQHNEKLKIDVIGKFNTYQANNNPYAWNLPQLELTTRGAYNIADKLIAKLDFNLETGRYAKMYDPTIEGVKMEDGILYKKLGVLADVNLGVEFRYTKRLSIFANFNNIGAQNYQRWYGYPVNAFQFMAGLTFRF